MNDLEALGFELSPLGNYTFAIQGVPSEIENVDASLLIRTIIGKGMEAGNDVKTDMQEAMALSFAGMTAIPYGRILTSEEMLLTVSQLFATRTPTYTPDGQKIVSLISDEDLEKKMH